MPPGVGALLKLIGGSPIGANVSKAYIGVKESFIMIQAQLAGVTNFVKSAIAVVQNPIGAVMAEVQTAISDAVASIPSLPALQDIPGVAAGQALAASATALASGSLTELTALTNELSGVTLPNPASLIPAGVSEVTSALGLGAIPELDFDPAKIVAPLGDAVTAQLDSVKTLMASIPTEIGSAIDPVAKAAELTGIIDGHIASVDTLVADSRAGLAQAAAIHAKTEQGLHIGDALTGAAGAAKDYAGKIATTAAKSIFGV